MPARNVIKTYLPNSYYHCYNRGVEKRTIFMDDQDYRVFLSFLKSLLSPIPSTSHPTTEVTGLHPVRPRPLISISEKVQLVCYCLMPNHFHLLIWQPEPSGMKTLMQKLCTGYAMYFNKKYQRVGALFQGTYKATNIFEDNYLLHLSRYIHLNPSGINQDPTLYPYSSLKYYLSGNPPEWLNPSHVLEYFDKSQFSHYTYQQFVKEYSEPPEIIIPKLTID